MKTMFVAFTAIIIISVGANVILGKVGFSSQDRTSGAAVRLSN